MTSSATSTPLSSTTLSTPIPQTTPQRLQSQTQTSTTRIALAIILVIASLGAGLAVGLLCQPVALALGLGSSIAFVGITLGLVIATRKPKNTLEAPNPQDTLLITPLKPQYSSSAHQSPAPSTPQPSSYLRERFNFEQPSSEKMLDSPTMHSQVALPTSEDSPEFPLSPPPEESEKMVNPPVGTSSITTNDFPPLSTTSSSPAVKTEISSASPSNTLQLSAEKVTEVEKIFEFFFNKLNVIEKPGGTQTHYHFKNSCLAYLREWTSLHQTPFTSDELKTYKDHIEQIAHLQAKAHFQIFIKEDIKNPEKGLLSTLLPNAEDLKEIYANETGSTEDNRLDKIVREHLRYVMTTIRSIFDPNFLESCGFNSEKEGENVVKQTMKEYIRSIVAKRKAK